ncbi:hypothetical protein GQ53DRAFT_816583 [Thozetella sp. PMI_491]|nr:hypothetical protein GQ53DRAFT_816583 [Thozetella sp. PMI_491]
MAAVEKVPSRQLSLQRMLELEKKYKLERLQGQQVSPASTPAPPVSYNSRPSLHTRRSDSLTQHQQNYLMLKAVQRSVTIPSLSITIPQGDGNQKRGASVEPASDKENQIAKEIAVEPLHKQVKFLAPDEDDVSDQSSICQSPSWEGYGQKKREKKLEAERKKKEKEQQDREARAAKRRLAARLSKPPPPARQSSSQPNAPFTSTERAKSDPLLISRQLASQEAFIQSSGARSTSTPNNAAVPGISDDTEFIGDQQMDQETQAAIEDAIAEQSQAMAGMAGMARPQMRKSRSMALGDSAAPASTSKDNRQSRDVHPPSASRTPMLRHASAIAHGRSNSLLSGASKIFRAKERSQSQQRMAHGNGSQESLQTMSSGVERGRRTNSYVQNQREQSNDQAMNGLVNGLAPRPSMPSRGSSHQGLSRRTSLAADATSVAKKLASLKPGSGSNRHGRSHSTTDYFTFLEQPYSPPALELLSPVGSLPASMREKAANLREDSAAEESQPAEETPEPTERPASPPREFPVGRQFLFPTTSLQPVFWSASSSKAPSIASTSSAPSRKSRSFKDAFASLSIHHRGSMPPTPHEAPRPKSPTFHFRTRMSTSSHGHPNTDQITSAPMALSPPLTTLQLPPKAARILGEYNDAAAPPVQAGTSGDAPIKTTTIQTQPNSRVSEGSSSSSAYDDASPLPSPATTPDTSRPQSSKGAPAATVFVSEPETDLGTAQDDEKTVRESPDSSGGPTRTGTPRQEASKPRDSKEMSEEDRWSRTALPLDLDIDAQSFVTSLSNLDNLDSIDEELSKVRAMATSPRAEILAAHAARVEALEKESQDPLAPLEKSPGPSKALSDPNLHKASEVATEAGLTFGLSPEAMIPPRSKKRDQANWRPSTAPTDSQAKDTKDSSEKLQPKAELKSFSELQAQEQERKSKQVMQEVKLGRSRETTRSLGKTQSTEALNPAKGEAHKPKRQQKKDRLREGVQEDPSDAHLDEEQWVAVDEMADAVVSPQLKRTATSNSVETTSSSVYSTRSSISGAPVASSERRVSSAPDSPKSTSSFEEISASPLPNPPSYNAALPPPTQAAPEVSSHPRSAPMSQPGKGAIKLPPGSASSPPTPAATSSSRPAGNGPVSILKQTSRSQSPPPASQNGNHRGHVLSALPKHMQLQAGMSSRAPATVAEQRVAPIAKMFVECCSCKFYHDMPSKLYECMAKPDGVVEDKLLGISGAITTMVKCPWCAHNMTTQCCAGYAAVVYLKERMH